MGISEYEAQNSVNAKGQLKPSQYVSFEYADGKRRVTFVGNSITRHGPKADIGWSGDWGMAASAKDRDYVHLVKKGLEERNDPASICIAQAAVWERGFLEDDKILENEFSDVRLFDADTLVVRIGENMKKDQIALCGPYFEKMIRFFVTESTKKIVVTDSFWEHQVRDSIIRDICDRNGYTFCRISDLGNDQSNMAIGQYEHKGVSVHPCDLGMERIADRILALI